MMMKVAQAFDYDDVRIVEMEVPRPGPGEALVKVRTCGICAGDVTPWYIRKKCPIVVGHEPAGDIVELGPEAGDWQVGDRVFIHHHAPCGQCRRCLRGFPSMCPTWRASHLVPGGIAQYCLVPRVNLSHDTLKLPAELSYDHGALIEPIACVVRAFHRCGLGLDGPQRDLRLAVVGLGFIGQVMVALAPHYGCSEIVGADFVEYRRRHALGLGAGAVVDPATHSLAEVVRQRTGGDGADIVMVGPSKPEVLQQAVHCAGPGGTVLLFMAPEPGVTCALDVNHLFFQEISLVTSYSCGPRETRETLEILQRKLVVPEQLITHRFPLEQTLEACRLTARAGESLKVVVDVP